RALGQEAMDHLDRAFTALSGELRSWLNEAFSGLRADLDVKASGLLERQIAVAGLVQVASQLQDRQVAMVELMDAARAGERLAVVLDHMPERLSVLAAGIESGERVSAQLQHSLEEVRSFLAGMQSTAADTGAQLSELKGLHEGLDRQLEVMTR